MKKSLYGMVCACCFLMIGVVSCDDGGSSKRYCDKNFVSGCQDGVYVQCENIRDGKGHVVEYKSMTRDGVPYFCNANDELVPEGYTCSQGQLVDSEGVQHSYLCSEANVVSCSGDEVSVQVSICDDINNKMVWCESSDQKVWEVHEESCGDNLCVEFERSGSMHAGCFERTGINEGCGDVDIKGACSGSTLTFCTHSDSKLGKRISLDCEASHGICTFIDDSWGYDCTEYCGTPEDLSSFATYRGGCEGNTLVMCVQEDMGDNISKIVRRDDDCGENAQCQFDASQEIFVCK